MKKILISAIVLLTLSAGCAKLPAVQSNPQPQSEIPPIPSPEPPALIQPKLREPIASALGRVTKKPFGIYINSKTSPVQPEKFSGYHTGVDFEVLDNEQAIDVQIFAACDGKLLLKKYATGYGGVAVQSCKLDNANVTIIYGHLKLDSITLKVGTDIKAGGKLAVLGKGYSTETDGERKHLHFAIHKGTTINILGYVQQKSLLDTWLDGQTYLK